MTEQALDEALKVFHASARVFFKALRALFVLLLNTFHAALTDVLISALALVAYAAERAVLRAAYASFTALENVSHPAPSAVSRVSTALFRQLMSAVAAAKVVAGITTAHSAAKRLSTILFLIILENYD